MRISIIRNSSGLPPCLIVCLISQVVFAFRGHGMEMKYRMLRSYAFFAHESAATDAYTLAYPLPCHPNDAGYMWTTCRIFFQSPFEKLAHCRSTEIRKPPITREDHQMEVSCLLIANKLLRHGTHPTTHTSKARCRAPSLLPVQTWATAQSSCDRRAVWAIPTCVPYQPH